LEIKQVDHSKKIQEHSFLLKDSTEVQAPQGIDVLDKTIAFEPFIKALQIAHNYTILRIEDKKSEIIYDSSAPATDANFILPYTSPKPNKTTLDINNLTVTYQLNFVEESDLIVKVLSLVIGLSFIFIVIASLLSSYSYRATLKKISVTLNDVIESSFTGSGNEVVIPSELQDTVGDIQRLIQSHTSNASVLEQKAYLEPVTQLNNRGRFVEYFENQVNKNSVKFGVLSITRCSELQTINQIHGYNAGDTYICGVADIMKAAITKYQGAQLFRLNSSDFATILPNTTIKGAETFATQLTEKFNGFQQVSDLDSVAYTGLVNFEKDKPLGELLALADTGISIAQTQQTNSWHSQTDTDMLENSSASYGNQNWRQEIDNVIENQRITLLFQPIKPSNRNAKVYGEVLARFLNSNDEMLPTASFVAMAEKLDKIVAIDKMIIEKVISEIAHKNLSDSSFGINISTRSIHDEHFLIWLERRLLRDTAIASKLIFEITEYGLQQNIKTSKRFIDMIHRAGAKVTVERFGVGLTSFKFFKDLKPDFIKMDSTYTRDIDEDKNNQYFLKLMVDLAHRLSIFVLAESVESQEEKFALEKLFIDGCQGFYIGKPLPL
jgi:EAL domain-containing protein (putative c-di-GMP-specific phosphodiesterase class I)/GGDEF domain-containing protein